MSGAVQVPAGFTVVARDAVTSTQDEVRALLADGAEDGTVVWAERQVSGRGRHDRHWNSPPGNLYVSMLVRTDVGLATAAQLSFVAALALWDALDGHVRAPDRLRLKWPNDVLLDGAKVSGILLETEAEAGEGGTAVIIGTGVNIDSHPTGTAFSATDLVKAGVRHLTPGRLLGDYLAAFAEWRGRWQTQGFGPVRTAWVARAAGLDGSVTVRMPDHTLKGRVVALDENGALVLETETGAQHMISAGDVFFG